MPDLNFTKQKPKKCIHCKKIRGVHKATTLNCPTGMKTRIGWTSYFENKFYEEKDMTEENNEEKKPLNIPLTWSTRDTLIPQTDLADEIALMNGALLKCKDEMIVVLEKQVTNLNAVVENQEKIIKLLEEQLALFRSGQ